MKILYKIIIIIIIYGLLAIPDNKVSLHIPKQELTASAKWWGNFAQNLVKFRITSTENQAYQYQKHKSLVKQHLDNLLLDLTEPDNPILDSINFHINKLSALASLMPGKITEYERNVARWRKLLKYQSRYWDNSSKSTQNRLFRLMIESRLAFESALIQSEKESISLSNIDRDISSTKNSVSLGNIQFKAGDIIAFNSITKDETYSSFIKELPNVYKHLGSVYIKDGVAEVVYLDVLHGLTSTSIDIFINEIGPNALVLRLRDDIPNLLRNPILPAQAATTIYSMANMGTYKYDHRFDVESHNHLYDWEFINMGFRTHNFSLDANEIIGSNYSIHVGGQNSHLNAFELELDHRFITVGEWYNTQVLYNNRLLTAATAAITNNKKSNDFLITFKLPFYRILKAYSMLVSSLGFSPPIPDGISAQTELIYRGLAKHQNNLLEELTKEIAVYETNQKHRATYLKMLQKANEIMLSE